MDYTEESGDGTAQTAPSPEQSHVERSHEDMPKPQSKRSPAFQFYPEAFLSSSKVMRMSLTERGAYITLLSVCWLDGSLPSDVGSLARTLQVPVKQFSRMWPQALKECFIERGGRLINPRLEIERKKQAEFRARQAEHGAKGGRPTSKGLGFETESQTEAKKSSLSLSVSPSLEERTHRQGGAPLHQSHKSHAACGRVCVPADLHSQFVRSRNHDGADKELREWYFAVDEEWSVGARKDDNPGGNDYQFWRARFADKWPATETKPHKWANWKPKAGARV